MYRPECPCCHQSDKVEKVSDLYSKGHYTGTKAGTGIVKGKRNGIYQIQ